MLTNGNWKGSALSVGLAALAVCGAVKAGAVPQPPAPPKRVEKPQPPLSADPLIPAKPGAKSRNEKAGLDLIEIPAGWFIMGSQPKKGADNEHPQRKVYLDKYRIGRTEVTVAQFRRFCQATKFAYDWNARDRKPTWGYVDAYPMVNVTWGEAMAFCRWAGGDLPTEAQWEKAARGTDGRLYAWGNAWDGKKLVHNARHPEPVGTKPTDISPYGVMDMEGNVMEWCKDYFDPDLYTSSPPKNPIGTKKSDKLSVRGGCWLYNYFQGASVAFRFLNVATDTNNPTRGFRIVFR